MSKRPTNLLRFNNRNNGCNNYSHDCECEDEDINGFGVFQDNVASVLYTRRMLNNRVRRPINIFNEGVNRTATPNLNAIDFIVRHAKCILQFLMTRQHRLVSYSIDDDEDVTDTIVQHDRVFQYYSGAGPLGDFISSYYIPRLGPWFFRTANNSGRLERFLMDSTTNTPLNAQEIIIVNRLSEIWNIPKTNNVTVDTPSILNTHYSFIKRNRAEREVFLEQYHQVDQSPLTNFWAGIRDLQFHQQGTEPNGNSVYNVNADGEVFNRLRLLWRTTILNYVTTTNSGGLVTRDFMVPITYRAVIPIPTSGVGANTFNTFNNHCNGFNNFGNNNCSCKNPCKCNGNGQDQEFNGFSNIGCIDGGVSLNSATGLGDMVDTYTSFSLPEIEWFTGRKKQGSPISWMVATYTTKEDLSVVDPAGRYADSGHTLLIVEALSLGNRRKVSYNFAQKQLQINYNHPLIETTFLRRFAVIVASIYYAYTGVSVRPRNFLTDSSVCSVGGTCSDSAMIYDYAPRESPMISVFTLATILYGQNILPHPDGGASPCGQ